MRRISRSTHREVSEARARASAKYTGGVPNTVIESTGRPRISGPIGESIEGCARSVVYEENCAIARRISDLSLDSLSRRDVSPLVAPPALQRRPKALGSLPTRLLFLPGDRPLVARAIHVRLSNTYAATPAIWGVESSGPCELTHSP